MGFNGALAICLQLKGGANTGTSYMGGFSGFFLRDQAAMPLSITKNRLPQFIMQ
jgi:hypothetical protein